MPSTERTQAVVGSNGDAFDVNLITTDEGRHIINCDGKGIGCPFRHLNGSLQACVLEIPKLGPDIVIACGKVAQETY